MRTITLYEINEAILACIDIETGEIIDEEALEALELAKEEKIEGVACWYKELCAEAEAIKKEKLVLAERQRVAENKAESLKKWLYMALDGERFKTAKVAITYRKSKAVQVTDLGLQKLMEEHEELLNYKAPEPNKTAIKKAIEAGELEINGITLVENTSTIIK